MDIWVGYEKQRQQFTKYLTRARADQVGNANFIMLYGGFGTGKSHALLWAMNRVLNVEAEEYNSVCYFIPSLKKAKGAFTFAGAFIDDIVSKSRLLADLMAYQNFLGTCIYKYRDAHGVSADTKQEEVIERLIPSVDLYNFAKELFKAESEQELRSIVVPKGLTDHQAVTIFTRIVNLFVHEIEVIPSPVRFKKAAYLFIDELDDLQMTSLKEQRLVNDTLRHIYDSCPNAFCLVIALSAEIAELPSMFEDFILSRIQRQIELNLLDKDDAVDFVVSILNRWRVDTDGPSDAFPFERSAIEAITSQLVEITPRKIVNTMQEVIEEVRLAAKNPADGPISLKDLDDADILDEVFGAGGIA
jgi:type II secretory pathway predicted ATPase ExeA